MKDQCFMKDSAVYLPWDMPQAGVVNEWIKKKKQQQDGRLNLTFNSFAVS